MGSLKSLVNCPPHTETEGKNAAPTLPPPPPFSTILCKGAPRIGCISGVRALCNSPSIWGMPLDKKSNTLKHINKHTNA